MKIKVTVSQHATDANGAPLKPGQHLYRAHAGLAPVVYGWGPLETLARAIEANPRARGARLVAHNDYAAGILACYRERFVAPVAR